MRRCSVFHRLGDVTLSNPPFRVEILATLNSGRNLPGVGTCRQSQQGRLELGLRHSRGFSHTFNFFRAKRKPFTALKPKPGKTGGVQLV
jgi:hypothetical protein